MSKQPLIENLEHIDGTKELIRDVLESKGIDITDEDTFRSYADKMEQLTSDTSIEEFKEVTPKTVAQTVLPSKGYKAIKKVTVKAVDSDIDEDLKPENIKKNVDILGVLGTYEVKLQKELEVNPSTEVQYIGPEDGFDGIEDIKLNPVTANIDKDIRSENIREGVNILGIEGTLKENNVQGSVTVDPETYSQEVIPEIGYDGIRKVIVNPVTSKIDKDIIPNNIRKGTEILGVIGEFDGNANLPTGGSVGQILTKNGSGDFDTVWKSYDNLLLYKGKLPYIPVLTQKSATRDEFDYAVTDYGITEFELTAEERAAIGADKHTFYLAWKIGDTTFGFSTDRLENFKGLSMQVYNQAIDGVDYKNKSMFTYFNPSTSYPVYINYYKNSECGGAIYTQAVGDNYNTIQEAGLKEMTKPFLLIFDNSVECEFLMKRISTNIKDIAYLESDSREMQTIMPFSGPFISFYTNIEPGITRRYGYETFSNGNFSYNNGMVMITTDVLSGKKVILDDKLREPYHNYDIYLLGKDNLMYVIENNNFVLWNAYYTKDEINKMFTSVEGELDKIINGG